MLPWVGDIDAAAVDAYQQPPLDASAFSVIDLTEVEFLSSTGVAFLIRRTIDPRPRTPAGRPRPDHPNPAVLQLTGGITLYQPVTDASGDGSTVSQQSA